MTIPDDLLCLFSEQVRTQDGRYLIDVPEREIESGQLAEGEGYRIGFFPIPGESQASNIPDRHSNERPSQEPPVDEGDVLDVEIVDIGDQGDGIARIDSGYVVFVPDTTLHEHVTIEITDARETMGFAEVLGRLEH